MVLALLASTLIHLTGCSTTGDSEYKSVHKTSSDANFPVPPGIEDNVEFWRKVYGELDRSQVVIHDNEHLGVVYEVVEVPLAYRGSSESRRAFLKSKQDEYRDRLALLERKLASGESLTAADRQLQAKLEAAGGASAVYGASDRVRTQQGMRERFRSGMEISGRYDKAFREIFRKHGVPEDLAFLPHVESSFQSKARSNVGAAGLWQFMPATGRVYDLKVDRKMDERMDPLLACEGAARYLASAHQKLGSWPLAITSYNHGQGGVAKAKSLYGNDIGKIVENYKGEAFGFDSRNFYSQFVAAREVAGNPGKYFPDGVAFHKPHDHDRLVLKHPMPAQQLASHYGLSVYQLDALNPSWSHAIVQGKAQIPAGSSVWLPAGTTERVTEQPDAAPFMIAKEEPVNEYVSVRRVTRPEPELVKASAKSSAKLETLSKPQATLAKADTKANAKAPTKTDTKAGAKSGGKGESLAKTQTTLAKASLKSETQASAKSGGTPTKSQASLARADTKGDPNAGGKSLAAKGKNDTKPVLAKTEAAADKGKSAKEKAAPKTHVVQPNETLFRVASMYDKSVDEIKKLNNMSPKENTIKTGQRLKVSG